ncbi:MAG: response regulator transcription factor [Lachnospiraceae bacterium]|nr:response regulator transcription factor [Lachnospiraceae bacterium]
MPEVLLIEKEEELAGKITQYLELQGLKVLVEHDALAALVSFARGRYDLILMDADFEEPDPVRALEMLRAKTAAPILAYSGKREEADAIRILDAGADDHIRKPLRYGELSARVMAALRQKERYQSAEIPEGELFEYRDIRVDCAKRRVWVGKKEKHLTRKEYDLLLFMMRHPGRVFTREELYRAVWNDEAVGGVATVTVHVRKLRDKIEERPSEPVYVGTDWGTGYVFLEEEPQW